MSIKRMKWSDIEPKDAVGLDLTTDPTVEGPLNAKGEVCAWPWEFQQLAFSYKLVHTCTHCGERGNPGLPHNDYRGVLELME